jgi:hypothetical protein
MSEQKVTIDELAAMVQRGFSETAKKADMDRGFGIVNERLERLILEDHRRRIERLEGEMKSLKDLLAVK